jgi:hypothetical protein
MAESINIKHLHPGAGPRRPGMGMADLPASAASAQHRLLVYWSAARQRPGRPDLPRLARLHLDRLGIVWFEIIGINMLASVGWDSGQFVRQLFWLALEPPGPSTA